MNDMNKKSINGQNESLQRQLIFKTAKMNHYNAN